MSSILGEKLDLHTPEAGLEPHDGEVPLLSGRPTHSKHSLIRPQHCLLGQYSPPHTHAHPHPRPTFKSWADPGPAQLLLQSTD